MKFDYDPARTCLKCGSPAVGTKHVEFGRVGYADALKRSCERCGYSWLERPVAVSNEREAAVLRDFVEWFDRWYPPGCAVLPGVPLWRLAERAREALAVSDEVDESGERDQ